MSEFNPMDGSEDDDPQSWKPEPREDSSPDVTPTPGIESDQHPLNVLGLRLTRACRYAFESQGVLPLDLVWLLHGLMGQVLLWEYQASDEPFEEGLDLDPDDDSDC